LTKNLDFSKQEMYEKLLNLLMKNGKKNTVRKIVNKALKKASLKLPVKDIHTILHTAIYNLSPDIELKSKRIGSTTYQIPVAVSLERKINNGIKQFVEILILRKERTLIERITNEIIDSYNNKGLAVKKRDEIHKLAEANKSFSHFNW
jgi:small subunit ribosomal protein S7